MKKPVRNRLEEKTLSGSILQGEIIKAVKQAAEIRDVKYDGFEAQRSPDDPSTVEAIFDFITPEGEVYDELSRAVVDCVRKAGLDSYDVFVDWADPPSKGYTTLYLQWYDPAFAEK